MMSWRFSLLAIFVVAVFLPQATTASRSSGKQEYSLLSRMRAAFPWHHGAEESLAKPPSLMEAEAVDTRASSLLSSDAEDTASELVNRRLAEYADNDDYLGGFANVRALNSAVDAAEDAAP